MANNSAVTAERRRDRARAGAAGGGRRRRARGGHEPGADQARGRAPQPGPAHGPPLRRRRRAQLPGAQAASCARRCSTRSPTCARATTSSSARAPAARPRSTCAPATWPTWASRGRPTSPSCSSATSTAAASSPRSTAAWRCSSPTTRRSSPASSSTSSAATTPILAPGLEQLRALHRPPDARRAAVARRACGSTPRTRSRSRRRGPRRRPPRGGDTLEVAVVRLRWMSNFTDVDALTAEPGRAACASRARPPTWSAPTSSLVPGTKATVEDLERLRAGGLDAALARRAAARRPDPRRLRRLPDARRGDRGRGREPPRDRRRPRAAARSARASRAEKLLRRVRRHRRAGRRRARHRLRDPPREPSRRRRRGADRRRQRARARAAPSARCSAPRGTGCSRATTVRRGLLAWVAARRGRRWLAGNEPFAAVRERHLDRLGDARSRSTWTSARWRR